MVSRSWLLKRNGFHTQLLKGGVAFRSQLLKRVVFSSWLLNKGSFQELAPEKGGSFRSWLLKEGGFHESVLQEGGQELAPETVLCRRAGRRTHGLQVQTNIYKQTTMCKQRGSVGLVARHI